MTELNVEMICSSCKNNTVTDHALNTYYVLNILSTKKVRKKCHLYCNAASAAAKSLQSCLTLCDPIDGSPAGSAVPGILQARVLEWVAIAFSSVL